MNTELDSAVRDTPKAERRWHLTGRRKHRAVRRVWVQHVDVEASLLEARLSALAARREVFGAQLHSRRRPRRGDWELQRRLAYEQKVETRVQLLLKSAREAANRKYPVPNPIMNWWGGRLIEAAYQNLHAAEALIAGLYDWGEWEAEVPEAVARVEAGLQRDDPRRAAALELLEMGPEVTPLADARAALSKAIEVGHSAADREHSRMRTFRNAVLLSGAVVAILLVCFALYVWFNPTRVPFCFTPPNAEGEAATWVCPTGEYQWDSKTPTVAGPTNKHDVEVIMLLGVLGGAFSAAISIRGLSGTTSPYDVPFALAFLKLPLGALTATAGLIALQGDFVPGLSELDSQGQILAYALIFGYAQQLLSGLLDKKAQALIDSAPGKEKVVQYTVHGGPGASSRPRSTDGRRW